VESVVVRLPERCGSCLTFDTIEATIQTYDRDVLLMWRCRVCGEEWPASPQDVETARQRPTANRGKQSGNCSIM
jgi:hypothetical protein